jgi:acetolactate synthase-1/2/3 large subunit
VHHTDLLIAIGMRFDDRITGRLDDFAEQAKVVHIDIDPAEISKNVLVDEGLVGDCKKILTALLKNLKTKKHSSWLGQIAEWEKKAPLGASNLKKCAQPLPDRLRARDILCLLNEISPDAFIVTDVGQHQMFTAQYFKFSFPGQLLTSGGLGDMGYGLPAGMGAKVARPEKTVWIISGDGSIQMNIQELITLVQDNINVKIAIFNNGFLGMVRQWQELFYGKRYVATPLLNPDFAKVAEAYGILGLRAKNFIEAKNAIEHALKTDGPALIEFLVEKEENVFPMVPPGLSLKDTRLE